MQVVLANASGSVEHGSARSEELTHAQCDNQDWIPDPTGAWLYLSHNCDLVDRWVRVCPAPSRMRAISPNHYYFI